MPWLPVLFWAENAAERGTAPAAGFAREAGSALCRRRKRHGKCNGIRILSAFLFCAQGWPSGRRAAVFTFPAAGQSGANARKPLQQLPGVFSREQVTPTLFLDSSLQLLCVGAFHTLLQFFFNVFFILCINLVYVWYILVFKINFFKQTIWPACIFPLLVSIPPMDFNNITIAAAN